MSKTFILLVLCFLSVSLGVHAQQDPQFTQYMLNSLYLNPGSAGIDGKHNGYMIYRNQWTGYSGGGNPETGIIGLSTKIHPINSGVGFFMVYDRLGPVTSYNLKLSYSYHLDVAGGKLGIGARGGMFYQTVSGDFKVNDENDYVVDYFRTSPTSTVFDLGLGAWFKKEKYYLGLSTNHINNPYMYRLSYTQNANAYTNNSSLVNHLYFTGGYSIELNDKIKVTPSALFKTDLSSMKASSVELSAIGSYSNDKFWGGLSFRQGDAAALLLGVGLLKDNSLKIGYAFDLIVSGTNAKSGTSNELFLSYSVPVALPTPKPIIRTPRYRF